MFDCLPRPPRAMFSAFTRRQPRFSDACRVQQHAYAARYHDLSNANDGGARCGAARPVRRCRPPPRCCAARVDTAPCLKVQRCAARLQRRYIRVASRYVTDVRALSRDFGGSDVTMTFPFTIFTFHHTIPFHWLRILRLASLITTIRFHIFSMLMPFRHYAIIDYWCHFHFTYCFHWYFLITFFHLLFIDYYHWFWLILMLIFIIDWLLFSAFIDGLSLMPLILRHYAWLRCCRHFLMLAFAINTPLRRRHYFIYISFVSFSGFRHYIWLFSISFSFIYYFSFHWLIISFSLFTPLISLIHFYWLPLAIYYIILLLLHWYWYIIIINIYYIILDLLFTAIIYAIDDITLLSFRCHITMPAA